MVKVGIMVNKYSPQSFYKAFLISTVAIDASGDLPSPEDLAHGFCFYYAYCFSKAVGGSLMTVMAADGGPAHAFVLYKGRYYDGDSIKGVKDLSKLQPYMRPNKYPVVTQKEKDFLKTWFILPKSKELKAFKQTIKNLKSIRADFK